jgi:hypothetical protein
MKLIAVHDRHHEIKDDQAGSDGCPQLRERFFAVRGGENREAILLEEVSQGLPNVFVVVDDQNGIFAFHRGRKGNRTQNDCQPKQRPARTRCASERPHVNLLRREELTAEISARSLRLRSLLWC